MARTYRPVVNDRLIALRLPTALRDAVADLAQREQRSMSQQIVKILLDALPPEVREAIVSQAAKERQAKERAGMTRKRGK